MGLSGVGMHECIGWLLWDVVLREHDGHVWRWQTWVHDDRSWSVEQNIYESPRCCDRCRVKLKVEVFRSAFIAR
jgi:hypothetical protein